MAKHIATRDIKLGSIDGDRWVQAGDEIEEGQLKDFPPGTYRTIDESTFPGGKCPTCGTVIPTTQGQAGAPPKPIDNPPSTQREAPQGDAARQAALDSMRMRPDNADSGLPSFGKIPIDVENSFVQGRATQQARRDPTTGSAATAPGATGGQFVPTRGQPQPSKEQRQESANAAPKPDSNEPNMGGFGAGGETAGAGGAAGGGTTTGSTTGTGDVASTGATANTGQAADNNTASVPSGRRGSANKP